VSVWTGAENLAPTGIRSPDHPARNSVAIPTELSRAQERKTIECLIKLQQLQWKAKVKKIDHVIDGGTRAKRIEI
jgi:hypothetical protein